MNIFRFLGDLSHIVSFLVLLSLFSYFYLKEALAALKWAAVGVCFGGTLLLALTLTPESWEGVDLGWLQLKLLLTLLAVPVALARAAEDRGAVLRSTVAAARATAVGIARW